MVADGVEESSVVLLIATLKGASEIGVKVRLDPEFSSSYCVLLLEEGEARSFWVPDEGAKFTPIICNPSDPFC